MKKDKRIKILFRLRSLEIGGVQKVMLDVAKNLPREKFDITLLLNLYQGDLKSEIPNDINLFYLAKGREFFSSNKLIKLTQFFFRRIKLLSYKIFPQIFYPLTLKMNHDIEVASSYIEFDDVLNSINKDSKKIAWYHNDVRYDKNPKIVIERARKMKLFNHVIFCSGKIRENIKKLYGYDYESHSSIVYNAIHKNEIINKSKEFKIDFSRYENPVFICVGRLDEKKGYDRLMDVHVKLLEEKYNHSIIILGEGPDRFSLEQKRDRLKISHSFHMLGAKKNPYPYIKSADFFLLCSKSEAYPLVLKEAIALEKPIIATNVGGVSEIVNKDIDALLVESNEQDLFDAMKIVMEHRESISKKMIEGIRKTSEKTLNTGSIYAQLIDIFEKQYESKK